MSSTPTSQNRKVRIIAMLNQKGGVGKTTSTVNLGAALAQFDLKVCLIDLDPQAHLTLHLGIEEDRIERTVYDLLIDPECTAREALLSARPNLDVILSEVDLAGAETELARTPDRQRLLQRKLEPIAAYYDVILIDCPPSLGLLTLNALSVAGEVLVPMQAHFLALQGVGKLLEIVGLVGQSVNPDLRVTGILLCMHEGQTTLAREVVADLDDFFTQSRGKEVPWRDCVLLDPPIRRNVKLAEAPSFGQTIFDYSPWCKGAIDYRRLARNLISRWNLDVNVKEVISIRPPAYIEAKPASEVEIEIISRSEEPAKSKDSMTPVDPPPVETAPKTTPVANG